MAKCCKCDKELDGFSKYKYKIGRKFYCKEHYLKATEKELAEQKKEKHERDRSNAILRAYDKNARKLIIDLIKEWKPRGCKSETDYTKSLKKFLDRELSPVEIYVGKESSGGLDSSRLDLVVGKKKPYRDFAIELKKDLKSSSNFDRLKGQIHTYIVAKFKHIIILLIGKTEEKLKTELKNYKKEMLKHYYSISKYGLDSIDVIYKK